MFFWKIVLYINLSRKDSPIRIVMVLDFIQTPVFLLSFFLGVRILFKKLLYWSVIDLQCCVNLCHTAKCLSYCCSSVAKSCPTLCDPHGLQHARLPCPSPSPGACSNSCPLSWWCHPTISSSAAPFSSCLQSFPASGSLAVTRLFESDGQSIEASASTSILPMNIQDWFPLELTGLISFQSKGLSRVFSSTTIWKHQFFGAQS